jgi:hypothetical protein
VVDELDERDGVALGHEREDCYVREDRQGSKSHGTSATGEESARWLVSHRGFLRAIDG